MRYTISPAVLAGFPGYVRGVVVARGCRNSLLNENLDALLREAEAGVRANAALDNVPLHPRVAAWRAAFSRFGATPSRFPSSVEAIVKRARRGDSLPYVNDLVAVGTCITLKHLLPTGGHDLAQVEGDLALRFAMGLEVFVPLGSTQEEHPEVGEVIFADARKVLCRRWTWRQADADKMSLDTQDLEMNVDGLPPASVDDVRLAMGECAGLLRRICGAKTREFLLTAETPSIEL
jgi:DNA/RNA-binding domain of Phe-tRNA-synthetase-like protein